MSEITKLRSQLIRTNVPNYQIAAACGIHPSTLSAYALGKEAIRPYHLPKLCEYFQCEPEDLIGFTFEWDVVDIMDADGNPIAPVRGIA